MSSRQLLTRSLKISSSFIKIDNAAYIHVGCSHNLNVTFSTINRLTKCRRNVIGTCLQVRHASTGSPTAPPVTTAAAPVLDPIPEPPTPLPEIADAVSKAFLQFYREENHSDSEAIMHTIKHSHGSVHDSATTSPEIYKTAIEIWKDPVSSENGPFENTSLESSMSGVVENKTNIFETSDISQQLAKGDGVDSLLSTAESPVRTIFDSIPDPPSIPEVVKSSAELSANGEPTFSSLGLGSWMPPGWVQLALEYLHVDCGLSWWASVAIGTLVVRLLMFPIVLISQRNAAIVHNCMPEITRIQDKMTDARHRGDKIDTAKYSMELMKFMGENKISPYKNIIPPLCQAPVFISMFMGMRGMTNLPVESLKEGGMLWFVDLTVPDQFYILPLLTSASLYCTISLGAEAVSNPSNPTGALMKYFLKFIPVVVFPFTMNFPGLLLVYWTTTNFFTLCQVGFLKIPRVRKYFNIPQMIKHSADEQPPAMNQGFIKSAKSAWTNMKITSQLEQRERADRMAFMQAGREPIKKTYKYDPTKVPPKPTPTSLLAKKRT